MVGPVRDTTAVWASALVWLTRLMWPDTSCGGSRITRILNSTLFVTIVTLDLGEIFIFIVHSGVCTTLWRPGHISWFKIVCVVHLSMWNGFYNKRMLCWQLGTCMSVNVCHKTFMTCFLLWQATLTPLNSAMENKARSVVTIVWVVRCPCL